MTHLDEIAGVLEELRRTTDRLIPVPNRVDLDRIEAALAERQKAVQRLGDLVTNYPDSFTVEHLEEVRRSQSQGKRALEEILAVRRQNWTTATRLSQSEYVLRSFAQFGSLPGRTHDA